MRTRREPTAADRICRQPGAPGRISTHRPPDLTSAALVATTAVLPTASAAPRDGRWTAPLARGDLDLDVQPGLGRGGRCDGGKAARPGTWNCIGWPLTVCRAHAPTDG